MKKLSLLLVAAAAVMFISSSSAFAAFAVGDCYSTVNCSGGPIMSNVGIHKCGPAGGYSFVNYADGKCYGEQWVRDAAATQVKPTTHQGGKKTMRK